MTDRYENIRKTLARYEPDTVYIGAGEYVAECVRADDGDYYLASDVDAEIERLREALAMIYDCAAFSAEDGNLLGQRIKDMCSVVGVRR